MCVMAHPRLSLHKIILSLLLIISLVTFLYVTTLNISSLQGTLTVDGAFHSYTTKCITLKYCSTVETSYILLGGIIPFNFPFLALYALLTMIVTATLLTRKIEVFFLVLGTGLVWETATVIYFLHDCGIPSCADVRVTNMQELGFLKWSLWLTNLRVMEIGIFLVVLSISSLTIRRYVYPKFNNTQSTN